MTTSTDQAIIELTPSAAAELLRLRDEQNIEAGKVLRIGVKGGGCSGLSYIMDYDVPTDDDHVFVSQGLEVAVSKPSAMYLWGMELEYEHGLNARGFTFKNPNAKSTCGCGTSFSA